VVSFRIRQVYLLPDETCGPQSRSGRFGEEKNIVPVLGFEHRIAQAGSPVVVRVNNEIKGR
jgi:hypothetical protein